MIHDLQAMDQLNQTFVDLGLETLRLVGTSPQNGGLLARANMSAIDTAKLLLLINGGPGTLWNAASGQPSPATRSATTRGPSSFVPSPTRAATTCCPRPTGADAGTQPPASRS